MDDYTEPPEGKPLDDAASLVEALRTAYRTGDEAGFDAVLSACAADELARVVALLVGALEDGTDRLGW